MGHSDMAELAAWGHQKLGAPYLTARYSLGGLDLRFAQKK